MLVWPRPESPRIADDPPFGRLTRYTDGGTAFHTVVTSAPGIAACEVSGVGRCHGAAAGDPAYDEAECRPAEPADNPQGCTTMVSWLSW